MKKRINIHPYMIIILTFLCVILLGSILLVLPIASSSGKSFDYIDSLFMATSATCVTGLGTLNVGIDMSLFGKTVMAFLMEIGGLSIITIATFFFSILGAKLSTSNKFLLREALNQKSVNGITDLIKKIMVISLVIQIVGIIVNMFPLMAYTHNDFWKSLGYSTFHSIASFNNAGFDCFGGNSLIEFKDNIILNTSTMFLIIFGGIGFIVFDDIFKNKRFKNYSLHTKIVLITTIILVFGGAILIKLTAWTDISWLQAFFTSVTTRTAGFTTYDMSNLTNHPAAYVIIVLLMLIGASPCSTGGGIKTTTIAIIFITIAYYARGKKAKAFKRSIGESQIFKAFVLITMAVLIVVIGTFAITAIQPELGLEKVLFEVASAFSTTGLTMGITTSLNLANKIIVCLLMFFGRLGPLTIIGVVNKNWMSESKEDIKYIEESVIVG